MRIFWLALIAVVVLGTFVYLWSKSRPQETVYEVATPEIQTITKKAVATGKIEPRNEVLIKPQISGIISKVYKEAGDKVQAGEVIAVVQVIPEMSQLNSAESRVNVAKIDAEQAEVEHKRNENLYESKVLSREEFEKSKVTYLRAKEELQNAIDNLELIKDGIAKRSGSFSNTQIRSTSTGTILEIPIKVGNSVIQSNNFNDGTTIATVANLSDMIFIGNIDETEVGRLRTNMPIILTIGAMQDLQFDAALEYISPKGVESNGAVMFEIKAAAHIPDSVTIRAGYSANAEIILQQSKDVLAIPENTVEITTDSAFVYLMDTTQNDNKQHFVRKPIIIGLSDGIFVEVVDGVAAEDKLRGLEIVK